MWDFLNLSARASPAKRKMTVLSPDHPLGNDIEFQRLFALSHRFGFISAREAPGSASYSFVETALKNV